MKTITLIVLASLTGLTASAAIADTIPNGNGATLCKNTKQHPGSCTLLQVECSGTYTEYVDPNGTVYGKCVKGKRKGLGLTAG
jgi:hypothetical protein